MTHTYRKTALAFIVALLFQTSTALAGGCVESVDKTLTFHEGGFKGEVARIASYVAVIAARDLVNSKGVRLKDFRAVMRQDRANFHKSGIPDSFGDIKERPERLFATAAQRNLLSGGKYYFYCSNSAADIAALKNSIVSGEVAGGIWVVLFLHPGNRPAIFLSLVG